MAKCHKCGHRFNAAEIMMAGGHNPSATAEQLAEAEVPMGDWDWVCYPCQFKMIDSGRWEFWRDSQFVAHGGGRCNH